MVNHGGRSFAAAAVCVANLVDVERSSSCQASSCRVRLKSPSRTAIGDRTMAEMNEEIKQKVILKTLESLAVA